MKSYLIIIMSLVLYSCERTTERLGCDCDFEGEDFDCNTKSDSLNYVGGIDIIITYTPLTERFGPCFNPNNENEVAFVLADRYLNENGRYPKHIVIANLETGQHRFVTLCSGESDWPSWSRKNKINANSKIIDASTLEFVEMPYNKYFRYSANWNYSGDKMLCWVKRIDDENWKEKLGDEKIIWINYPSFEIEKTGLFIDDDNVLPQSLKQSVNNEFIFSRYIPSQISYSKVSPFEEKVFFNAEVDEGKYGSGEWHINGNEFYFANKGIYYIRKGENKQYRLKKHCNNRYYEHVTISPMGDKIIAQRVDVFEKKEGYIEKRTNVVIMDIDGCNEKVLFEDWDGTVVGRP